MGPSSKIKKVLQTRQGSFLDNIIFQEIFATNFSRWPFLCLPAFAFFGISIFLPILLQSMHVTDQKFLALSIMAVCSLGYFLEF